MSSSQAPYPSPLPFGHRLTHSAAPPLPTANAPLTLRREPYIFPRDPLETTKGRGAAAPLLWNPTPEGTKDGGGRPRRAAPTGLSGGQQIRGNGRGRSPAPTRFAEVPAVGRCGIGPYGVWCRNGGLCEHRGAYRQSLSQPAADSSLCTKEPWEVPPPAGGGDHQVSLPFSSGMTSSRERMAHSIMLSSGSKVVKFCIHRPGAVRNFVRALSVRPTQRLNS